MNNDAAGIAALCARLHARRPAPALVVLAATGLSVAVVHPRHVRAFAHAIGQLAKTDARDAALLARFAAAVRPTPHAPPAARRDRAGVRRAAGPSAPPRGHADR